MTDRILKFPQPRPPETEKPSGLKITVKVEKPYPPK